MVKDKIIIDFVKRHEYARLESLQASFNAYLKNINLKASLYDDQFVNRIIDLVESEDLFRVECGDEDGVCIASAVLYDDEVVESLENISTYIARENLRRGNIIENQTKLIEFALFKTRSYQSDNWIGETIKYLEKRFNVSVTYKNVEFVLAKNEPNTFAEPLCEKINKDLTVKGTHYTTLDKFVLNLLAKGAVASKQIKQKVSILVRNADADINASDLYIDNSLWFLQYKHRIKFINGMYVIRNENEL